MYPHSSNPALVSLGDRLEAAAGDAIAGGRDRPPRRRWLLAPMAAVVALLVLGAVLVLPTGDGGTAEAAVQSAAQQTTAAETGRFQLTAQASGLTGLGGDEVSLVVDGAFDLPADRYTASVDLTSLLGSLPAEAIDAAGAEQAGGLDVVVDGPEVYVRLGAVLSLLGSDAEWVSVTAPELTEGSAESPVPPLQDPGAFLDALNGAGADMAEVGSESVRGVDTTHYEGTLSTVEALESLDAEERADLEAALGGVLAEVALPDLPVGVWIDGDGFVRRISIALDGSSLGIPEVTGSAFSVTVEFFDLGEPVAIEVPAPEEVVDVDELLADLEASLDGLELPSIEELEDLFGDLPESVEDLDLGDLERELDDALDDLFGGDEDGAEEGGAEEGGEDGSGGDEPAPAEPAPQGPGPQGIGN